MVAIRNIVPNLIRFNQKYSVSYPDRTYSAFTRCYELSDQDKVTHLTRLKPLSSLTEAQDILEAVKTGPEFQGLDAVLYVRQQYMPPDLRSQLPNIPYFERFCKVLALSRTVSLLAINDRELPYSINEHSECRRVYCPGIPITKPVIKVDMNVSYSFDLLDYRDFLGNYYRFAADPKLAGKMVHLAVNNEYGERLGPVPLAIMLIKFINILAREA